MLFRIARSKQPGKTTHYDLYKVKTYKGMTVLDALFQIQDKMDPSLAFRYSCRGAVCGSCAMLIDKEPRLACRTQVSEVKGQDMKLTSFETLTKTPEGWDKKEEILVEPLPNLPILKDLVVDMTKFYDALKILELWAEPAQGDEPRRQTPEDREKIKRYVGCIMCAICYGSCPVNYQKEEYLGPASLAKAWRYHEDTRTDNPKRYLESAKTPHGVPLCDLIMNCVRSCPKGVAPGGAIQKMKKIE